MNCRICNSLSSALFTHKVLHKYDVHYFVCGSCGFIQTEEPYWLAESYKEPINASDTGYVYRNIWLSKVSCILFLFLFKKNSMYVDYGAGYGMSVRLMRDYGLDFYWFDTFTQNIFSRGFEYTPEAPIFKKTKVQALTSFECFEHFKDPDEEFKKMLKISKNIFFSTELITSSIPPGPQAWWYYGFSHGQHLSLYTKKSLEYMAKKYNLFFCTNGQNLHMFSEKKISPLIFRSLVFTSRWIPNFVIRRFLKSKTQTDSMNLKSQEER